LDTCCLLFCCSAMEFFKLPKQLTRVYKTTLIREEEADERDAAFERTILSAPPNLQVQLSLRVSQPAVSETQAAPHGGPPVHEGGERENPLSILPENADIKESFRVHVGGMKGATEDHLKRYLHEHGCNVANIETVADKKRAGRLRFAYVNLEDSDSFKTALELGEALEREDKEVNGLGKLRIAQANPRS